MEKERATYPDLFRPTIRLLLRAPPKVAFGVGRDDRTQLCQAVGLGARVLASAPFSRTSVPSAAVEPDTSWL